MRATVPLLAFLLPVAACAPADGPRARTAEAGPPPLPLPTTNHAVAGGIVGREWRAYVALGLDSTKRWSGITTRAWEWREGEDSWRRLPPVPGPVGRIAALAAVVRERLFVFGGYTVDSAGHERTLGNVDIWDPVRLRWSAGAPIPIPVDDAILGVHRDSLVYLVSGWRDSATVRAVQVYDVQADRWRRGTPIPAHGVFGHAGAMTEGRIVFIDGAHASFRGPRYVATRQAWLGTVHPTRPDSITWERLPDHPPPTRYRAAAGACGPFLLFAGGTDNPYNYDGIGYDGRPSAPLSSAVAYDVQQRVWRPLRPAPRATMDHRGLLVHGRSAYIVGGMGTGQRVTAEVTAWHPGVCPP
jgi:N-acetylneuraminic acid mutarotase